MGLRKSLATPAEAVGESRFQASQFPKQGCEEGKSGLAPGVPPGLMHLRVSIMPTVQHLRKLCAASGLKWVPQLDDELCINDETGTVHARLWWVLAQIRHDTKSPLAAAEELLDELVRNSMRLANPKTPF